jgi:hypothetical protein
LTPRLPQAFARPADLGGVRSHAATALLVVLLATQAQAEGLVQPRPPQGAAPLRALAVLPDESFAVTAARSPAGEPTRAVAEYLVSTLVFSGMNAAGGALLSHGSLHVSNTGAVSLAGNRNSVIAAGSLFVLSPFGAALSSYLVGRGSDTWKPGLLSPTLGAYGMSAVAVAAGLGIATTNVDRNTAIALNGALFLSVPLAAVLLQNATKDPRALAAP